MTFGKRKRADNVESVDQIYENRSLERGEEAKKAEESCKKVTKIFKTDLVILTGGMTLQERVSSVVVHKSLNDWFKKQDSKLLALKIMNSTCALR